MKRKIRLTESDLHKIVKESVKRVLKDGNIRDLFDKIDEQLSAVCDAHVSRFYSDENNITIAVSRRNVMCKNDVIAIMKDFGYGLYDTGVNGEYLMMTFQ